MSFAFETLPCRCVSVGKLGGCSSIQHVVRGPDVFLDDMRLEAISEETAGSDGFEPLAVGMSEPLGLFAAAAGTPTTTAYVNLPSGFPVAGCGHLCSNLDNPKPQKLRENL